MIKKIGLFFVFFLCLQGSNYAQSTYPKKNITTVLKKYQKELNLSKEQSKKIKTILLTYNPEITKLINSKASSFEINKLVKLESLEIFKILSREQYTNYKKLKKVLETNKRYRK
jgi:predicted XRE-type DNA-binding protein